MHINVHRVWRKGGTMSGRRFSIRSERLPKDVTVIPGLGWQKPCCSELSHLHCNMPMIWILHRRRDDRRCNKRSNGGRGVEGSMSWVHCM